jgi:hypothetical protein
MLLHANASHRLVYPLFREGTQIFDKRVVNPTPLRVRIDIPNAPLSISVMKEQLRMLAGAHPMRPRRFERVQACGASSTTVKTTWKVFEPFREKRKLKFLGRRAVVSQDR